MNGKREKKPPETPKKAAREIKDHPELEDLSKNAPRPIREDSDNLRQRAEWFRRRSGGERAR